MFDVLKKMQYIIRKESVRINNDSNRRRILMNEREVKDDYVEFRYYEVPMGRYDLALLGEEWECEYGLDPFHFHNLLEIGYCYEGDSFLCLGEEKKKYSSGSISIIPANFPHRTMGKAGVIEKWEYLFLDITGVLNKFYADNLPFRKKFMRNLAYSPCLVSREEYPELASVIKAILDENRKQKRFFKDAINGYLLVLVQEIARLKEKEIKTPAAIGRGISCQDKMELIG